MKEYYISKKYTDNQMENMANTFVTRTKIDHFIDEDADIYSEDGKLLAKFRKNVLSENVLNQFYDATYKFTLKAITANRGDATGSKKRNLRENPRVHSAILGYFNRWAPKQKIAFRNAGIRAPLEVRETRFSMEHPEKFKQTFPLLRQINQKYKSLLPSHFQKQNKKAKNTLFKIPQTSFTTITTNINFQTAIHKDSGDDEEGFGNLVVIERGNYAGGETCLPQYGIGINVRQRDILFMDVHEWHGNLPIVKKNKDAVRLSVVCYLRKNVWKRTKQMTFKKKKEHLNTLRKIKYNSKSKTKKSFIPIL